MWHKSNSTEISYAGGAKNEEECDSDHRVGSCPLQPLSITDWRSWRIAGCPSPVALDSQQGRGHRASGAGNLTTSWQGNIWLGVILPDHAMDPRNTGELCIVILNLPPSWHNQASPGVCSTQRTVSGCRCVETTNACGWCGLLGTLSPWDLNSKLCCNL